MTTKDEEKEYIEIPIGLIGGLVFGALLIGLGLYLLSL